MFTLWAKQCPCNFSVVLGQVVSSPPNIELKYNGHLIHKDSTSKEDERNWLATKYFLYLADSYTKNPLYQSFLQAWPQEGANPRKITNGSRSKLRYRALCDITYFFMTIWSSLSRG